MSFILDALRKSELARERQALPGYAELPASGSAPSRLPLVLFGIALLLLINVGVLTIVLMKRTAEPTASTPVINPATAEPQRLPSADGMSQLRAPARTDTATHTDTPAALPYETRPLSVEAEPDVALDLPEPHAAPSHIVSRAPNPAHVSGQQSTIAARREQVISDVPLLSELSAGVTAGMPRLNLDLLVYSEEPKQRFVMINGQRLREGDSSRDGMLVERIESGGAVINYRGSRFLLTRN
jgi:general secretion pathway protein B